MTERTETWKTIETTTLSGDVVAFIEILGPGRSARIRLRKGADGTPIVMTEMQYDDLASWRRIWHSWADLVDLGAGA